MASMRPYFRAETGQVQPIDIDRELAFEHPALERCLALWQQMAAGRPMPERRDVDPLAHGRDLRYLSLFNIHWTDGRVARVSPRLLGSDFEDALGSIGSPKLEESMSPVAIERWRLASAAMVDHGGPVRAMGRLVQEGRRHLAFELLLAPMSDNETPFAAIYVISVFKSDI